MRRRHSPPRGRSDGDRQRRCRDAQWQPKRVSLPSKGVADAEAKPAGSTESRDERPSGFGKRLRLIERPSLGLSGRWKSMSATSGMGAELRRDGWRAPAGALASQSFKRQCLLRARARLRGPHPDSEPCSLSFYDLAGSELLEGSPSACRSTTPWFGTASVCRTEPDLVQSQPPNRRPDEHIAAC